jgi:hypothetical protein
MTSANFVIPSGPVYVGAEHSTHADLMNVAKLRCSALAITEAILDNHIHKLQIGHQFLHFFLHSGDQGLVCGEIYIN